MRSIALAAALINRQKAVLEFFFEVLAHVAAVQLDERLRLPHARRRGERRTGVGDVREARRSAGPVACMLAFC